MVQAFLSKMSLELTELIMVCCVCMGVNQQQDEDGTRLYEMRRLRLKTAEFI